MENSVEDEVRQEMEKTFEEAGKILYKRLGKPYSREEFLQMTQHPFLRETMVGSPQTAEFRLKRRKEREQQKIEIEKQLRANRRAIFNAYDVVTGRIPEMFHREVRDLILKDSNGRNIPEDILVFPDGIILNTQGYNRLHDDTLDAITLRGNNAAPSFYPVPTEIKSHTPVSYAHDIREFTLDILLRIGDLGKWGPLAHLPNGHWSLMFSDLPQSFEWLLKALRTLEKEQLHDLYGDEVEGSAYEYAVRLCPTSRFCSEFYFSFGNHLMLREDLERPGFTKDIINDTMREAFHPLEELESPEPTVQEEIGNLVELLYNHFKIKDRSDIQPLLAKALDYLCPGVLEVLKK